MFKTLFEVEKKMGKGKEMIKKAISVVLAIVLFVCVILLTFRAVHQKKEEAVYENMRETAVTAEREEPETTEVINSTEKAPINIYEGLPDVDFKALWEINTDVCAWISVPGTQVDYPVLRREEAQNPYDDYYLQHTAEKTAGLPGAIYMEPCNAADFSDANTVLYGHNMRNGTMFGSLHEFENDDFFDEHEDVYVVTPEKTFVYRIYAAVTYSDLHIMGSYDFDSPADFERFADSLREGRSMTDLFREELEVTAGAKLLTLSTCIKGEDDKRFLVVAVLTDEVPADEN